MRLSQLHILLAEDRPDDVLLFQTAMRRTRVPHTLHVVDDGSEAKSYLMGEGKFADRQTYPFPTCCILDLKMPNTTGLEVLDWMQQNPQYSVVPVLMISSSTLPEDVHRAYRFSVNTFFAKPTDFNEFTHMLSLIMQYWRLAYVPFEPGKEGLKENVPRVEADTP